MADKSYYLPEIRAKIQKYCAYRERCHSEVRKKLRSMGVSENLCDNMMAELIQDNFLNEQRFADAYTSGKFKMKGWGKVKIRQMLRSKFVPEHVIENALSNINNQEYIAKLEEICKKKLKVVSGTPFEIRGKLYKYLYSRGYETDVIKEVLNNIEPL